MNAKNSTREERRKEKELNEARKAGTLEAEKDEEGNDINPHMPQYIVKAPWYLNQTQPSLKHQRKQATEKARLDAQRNKKVYLTKDKKVGSEFCKNCGRIGHTDKFCLERTRKKKVKYHREDDEEEYICVNKDLGYDGNRDRWVNYNPEQFKIAFEEFEKVQEEEKKKKAEKLKRQYERKCHKRKREELNGSQEGENKLENDKVEETDEEEEEEDCENSNSNSNSNDMHINLLENANINAMNTKDGNRSITKNLRIREDTAKYLYNLNLNSAFYDPKSRSMRDDPFKNMSMSEIKTGNYYRGENYYNFSGEALDSKKLEVFAWETYKRGESVHFNAHPTQVELMYREYKEKKQKLEKEKQEQILKKYKCDEVTKELPREEHVIYSDVDEEYNKPKNEILLDHIKEKVSSIYAEDMYTMGHTSVFGSYYDTQKKKWGYKCCKILDKLAKCTYTKTNI